MPTEAEAKEVLEGMGFEVIDVADGTFRGYSIEEDKEHGCWVVFEMSDYPQHGTLRKNLSGWGANLSLVEALQWLQARIKEGKA